MWAKPGQSRMSFFEKSRATLTDSHVLIPVIVLVLGIALLVTLR